MLSNKIHVGKLNKAGDEFLEKQDMTMEAFMAVINHIKTNIEDEGNNTVNIGGGDVLYSLTLEVLDPS